MLFFLFKETIFHHPQPFCLRKDPLIHFKINVRYWFGLQTILVLQTAKLHKSVLNNVCVARSRHASKDGAHATAIKLSSSHLVPASTAFFVLYATSCLSLNGDNSICVMECHSLCLYFKWLVHFFLFFKKGIRLICKLKAFSTGEQLVINRQFKYTILSALALPR